MSYQLIKIKPDEIEKVHDIVRECGLDMKLRLNLDHWESPYPIQLMRKDARERSIYAVKKGEQTVATFTISTQPLEYYNINIWQHPKQKAIYVSHLAVLPNLQGKGIGTWSMGTIEQIATAWGCGAVRLDAYEKHDLLIKFYDNLGYHRKEVIKYHGLRLVCFEKIIKNNK